MNAVNELSLADQVWIATALLHQEHPEQEAFAVAEIENRARQEFGGVRPGLLTYLREHAIANRKPNPGRRRFLWKTPNGKLRLFTTEDPFHPDREGSKVLPDARDLPEQYQRLLQWYNDLYVWRTRGFGPDHPFLKLIGVGASGRSDTSEHHDEVLAETLYQQKLRHRPALRVAEEGPCDYPRKPS